MYVIKKVGPARTANTMIRGRGHSGIKPLAKSKPPPSQSINDYLFSKVTRSSLVGSTSIATSGIRSCSIAL